MHCPRPVVRSHSSAGASNRLSDVLPHARVGQPKKSTIQAAIGQCRAMAWILTVAIPNDWPAVYGRHLQDVRP
jgi:hypothetical protein